MKLGIFQVYAVSCYFLPIRPKYLLHLRTLEHKSLRFILHVIDQVSYPIKMRQY